MNKDTLLATVNTPRDVKQIAREDLPLLCEQIRAFLIDRVPRTGGHLASNLGAVELTVALHRVFDCPNDHVIFDVGHQAYVHKILTERKHLFADLRKPGGLSGFTSRKESPYDAFGAGHSSTSISAALGFAETDFEQGRDAYTVCVVGDGAYTGGMIHEALNNCKRHLRLVIILNENGMSISPTRGTFANCLSRVRLSARYRGFKRRVERKVGTGTRIGRFLRGLRDRLRRAVYPMNHFEELGLYYIGPVDGNDVHAVTAALTKARSLEATVVVHLRTAKGKGYEPAELSPDRFHSVRRTADAPTTFHGEFCRTLTRQAEEDSAIVAVTAAMGMGTGLSAFGERFPERYFDVGIAEGHAVTFAAGLAAAGQKPYAVIYSTFLQRAYDSIIHDVALQGLPVRLIIDRAGLAVADGPTHHGIFDVAFLGSIPGVRLLAPVTYGALELSMRELLSAEGPIALRYADAAEDARVLSALPYGEEDRLGIRTSFPREAPPARLIVTYGMQVTRALEAAELLADRGLSVGVVLLERLLPHASVAEALAPIVRGATHVVFAEEGVRTGGVSVGVSAELYRTGALTPATRVDIAAIDDFAAPEGVCDLYDAVGLSARALAARFC